MMEEILRKLASSPQSSNDSDSAPARGSFPWGGTISALVLLLVNRGWRRSIMQTNLLVLYLLISFPSSWFQILRGQFGRWIAFLAVVAHLFFPETYPASRFVLFVITPSWVVDGLRDSMYGGVLCLSIGLFLLIEAVWGIMHSREFSCGFCFFIYCIAIGFLFFFTISYP